jgi:hypothetical protein
MKKPIGTTRIRIVACLAATFLALPALAGGDDDDDGEGRACTRTAQLQYGACTYEALDELLVAQATCTNVDERRDRRECFADARRGRQEAHQLCQAQRRARIDLCGAIGEDRYAPDFDAVLFESDLSHPRRPNPYFPLGIGNEWVLEGGGETVRIRVLDKTKLVAGVPCLVVNDRVEVDGFVVEDTDDWLALRLDGTLEYCGESVRDFAFTEGDVPLEPELIDIAGSFKAGRDGSKSGTFLPGAPVAGSVYRQEWSPGNAEDAALIRSRNYRPGRSAELDAFVPRALVDALCGAGDCLVVDEFSPVDPSALGRKFYAKGLGFFLEVKPATGEVVQLVGCNFDGRCAKLHRP